jgi:hypothetical protein
LYVRRLYDDFQVEGTSPTKLGHVETGENASLLVPVLVGSGANLKRFHTSYWSKNVLRS